MSHSSSAAVPFTSFQIPLESITQCEVTKVCTARGLFPIQVSSHCNERGEEKRGEEGTEGEGRGGRVHYERTEGGAPMVSILPNGSTGIKS